MTVSKPVSELGYFNDAGLSIYIVGRVKKASSLTPFYGFTTYFVLLLPSPSTRTVLYFTLDPTRCVIVSHPGSFVERVALKPCWLKQSTVGWLHHTVPVVNPRIVYCTLQHCVFNRLKERPDFCSFKPRFVLLLSSIQTHVSGL